MTYTVDDTMKKLLGAPEAVAVLERFFPKILKNPALQMTAAMTLRQVAGFAQSGLTADSLAEIDAQLRRSRRPMPEPFPRAPGTSPGAVCWIPF